MKAIYTIQNFAKRLAMMLAVVLVAVNAWGGQYTYDFSSCANWYTAANKQTACSNGTDYASIYDTDAVQWTIATSPDRARFATGYFILGKSGIYINMPTYSGEKITSVVIHNSSACSQSVAVNIYTTGGTAASTAQTWSTQNHDYTYTIDNSYQSSALRIQITTAYRAQITSVTINTESNGYAVTYNNGGHGTAPSNTTASAVTLSAITGVTGYTCTGWKANVAVTNTSTSASISAGTLIPNGTNVTLSGATTFTAQWETTKYTVSFGVSPAGYGTVSQASVTNVPHGTVPSSSTNTVTVNGTTVTATPAAQDADYNYAFSSWSGIPGTVTGAVTITANFTRTLRPLTNYRTTCCTELGAVGGAVNYTDPTTAVLTWNDMSNVDATTPYVVTYRTGSDAYGSSNVGSITTNGAGKKTCTITGLSCNTDYDFKIAVTAASGYCDKEEILEDQNSGTWTVTSTITNGSKTSVPTTACGNYTATFAVSDGYHFPDAITVTGASSHTWTKATGTLTISGANITGNITISITCPPDACDDYSFFYGTTKGSENNYECFSFVTGSTDTWLTDLWTIPSSDQWTYVGEPDWDASTGKSANLQLSSMPYALNHANNLGSISSGVMEGAQGYVKICTNSSDANRYVGFIPAGYVFRWGTDGSGWNSIAFTGKTAAIEEEDWYTPLQTWTSSNADDYTYVGLKTSSGYVWANRSETRRPVFLKPTSAWDHSNAYFAIYYFDASSHTGWSAIMTDPDGDGIYEAWIPNDYTYTTVNFVRLSTDATGWGNKWNQTGDITLPSDKNVFTITGGSGDAYTGSWSLYDKKGTFHISANSNTNNWYCHFLPHHVLHYDANGGEGAPADQTIAINASPCQLTVSTTEPTRTGYTFAGWNESSSAASKDDDWDGGDTHTMSADVTLYAVWTANTNTPYTVKHYKQKLDGTYPASPDETDNLTGTTATSVTPARKSYTGFTAPSGQTVTILADGSRVVEYQYSRNSYTLAWSLDGGSIDVAGTTAGSVKFEASLTAPTVSKTGYTFNSWSPVVPSTMPAANSTYTATWTANTNTAYTVKHYKQKLDGTYDASPDDTDNLTGTTGASITPDRKSYEGFTAPSGTTTTILADGSRVVEYQYTRNSYNIAVQTISYVTIKATPTGESAITEGNNADAAYGNTITLNYSSKDSRYTWGGWRVTKADDASVSVCSSTSNNATFSMPAYAVKVTAYLYGDLKAWCDPDVTVTGDIHLTSTKDVPVRYSTGGSDNLVTISSSDMGSATTMEVAYLNADAADAEVDKDDSPFRFYKADGSATTETLDLDYEWETSHPISYTPSAYSVTNNYKLQLNFKKGDKVLKTLTHAIHGRGLPEEFVIAVKKGGVWVALPSNLASTSAQPSIIPRAITVNDNESPTTAIYAPTTTVYKAKSRGNDAHISTLRFTTTGSNYLQVSGTASEYNMWLSGTNSANVQDWQLKSSDNSAYELTIPSNSATKKMGIYSNTYMGYHGSPNNANIYFLPITNKYTDVPATVHEWGEHGAIIEADMTNVASATMHVADGSPAAATLTAVNAASLTEGKYVRVYKSDMTVGAVGNESKQLYVHWKNAGGDEIGVSQMTIPTVIAADNDMHSIAGTKTAWAAKSEVHILPGVTLDANAGSFDGEGALSVSNLFVYPGATLKVSTGTFNATTLRLRNGWTRAGEKQYNSARVYIASGAALTKTTASMDYDIYEASDGKHYYPLAVPFATAVNTIDYIDPTLATASKYNKHFVIKKYDGARRAESGPDQANNWVVMADGDQVGAATETLQPGKGYIMTAVAVKGSAILRVPLTFNNGWTSNGEKATYDEVTKNVVAVEAYGGAAATAHQRHKGWNMLGVPFMSSYGNVDDIYSGVGAAALINGELVVNTSADQNMQYQSTTIPYVSVPSHDFAEYVQTDISEATLLPGWSFFVQVNTDGNLTFAVSDRRPDEDNPIYAPRRSQADEVLRTGIILSGADASDKTTILVSDRYNGAKYEIGADLEKMFGNGYTLATYSLSGETRLAYNAMSKTEAQGMIPIGFRAPEDGEYTFSLNPRYADAPFERVDLIDYQTGELTNMLTSSYTFATERTQNDTRFALNVVMKKDTPTDIETVGGEMPEVNGVRKLLINDKLYIIRGNEMYDATGKKVSEINK